MSQHVSELYSFLVTSADQPVEQFELRDGAHIIVATPGRLKDLIEGTKLVLSQCRYVSCYPS